MLYTIGHGDRTLDDLLECLRSFGIAVVADVRSYPASRHHPHFGREELEPALTTAGFTYRWLGKELGGFRSEGYEAHMETALYREGIDRLLALAREAPTVVLCAERDPAECHRRHIATTVKEQGLKVRHILGVDRLMEPGERPEDQGTLF
jgi:uncharacterized protein (DUF488 family)